MSSYAQGYRGEGFYFTHVVSFNDSSNTRITGITLSLDYGNFSIENSGPPSLNQAYGETRWITIPSTETVGNHTFTVTANYQFYNNDTKTWITPGGTPRILTGTLNVLPDPTVTARATAVFGTILPVSAGLLVGGITTGAFALKRNRKPSPTSNVSTRGLVRNLRSGLLPAVIVACSVALALFIWDASQINIYARSTAFWAQAVGFALLPLIMAVTAFVFRRDYHRLSLLSILLLSLSATLGSTVSLRNYRLAGPCSPGLVVAGFPFPWLPIWYPYLYSGNGPLPQCPFYVTPPVFILGPSFFLLDMLFYGSIMLAVLEFYRALKMTHYWLSTPTPKIGHA